MNEEVSHPNESDDGSAAQPIDHVRALHAAIDAERAIKEWLLVQARSRFGSLISTTLQARLETDEILLSAVNSLLKDLKAGLPAENTGSLIGQLALRVRGKTNSALRRHYAKKRSAASETDRDVATLHAAGLSAEEIVAYKEFADRVDALVDEQVDRVKRTIFHLGIVEGLPATEIHAFLVRHDEFANESIPAVGAIQHYLRNERARLARILRDEGYVDDDPA